MQYNMPGMKIATNSLGIGMANTAEDTFNNLLVHSYQRQSRGNVIDKIQSRLIVEKTLLSIYRACITFSIKTTVTWPQQFFKIISS